MNHLGDTNKMVSDTPRMNAARNAAMEHMTGDVWRVGCQLEHELNAANESFRKLNIHTLNLVDRIRRLEEAGDRMEKLLPEGSICDKAVDLWRKAKEDKLSVNPIQSLGANLMKAGIGFTTEDKP